MNCPNCDKIIQGGRSICHWCGALITNLDAGFVASPGKRFAGYILDIVVWIFIWVIISTMIVGASETDSGGIIFLGVLLLFASIIYYFILLSQGKSYGKCEWHGYYFFNINWLRKNVSPPG